MAAPENAARSGPANPCAWVVRLLFLTLIVYSRSLGSGFVFDDRAWAGNPYVRNWSFVWKSFANDAWWFMDPDHPPWSAYYRPLLDAWAGLNFHLFGLHPAGWHAMEIGFHLLAVWMVYRVASMLSANDWTGLLAAGLFALAPVSAESVAWPSAVCQPLYAIFALGAFEFYLRARLPAEQSADRKMDPHRIRSLAISLAMLAGGLLTYETAVLFPFLIAAYACIFAPAPVDDGDGATLAARIRAAAVASWPYAIEVASYLALRFRVLGFISHPNPANHMSRTEAILTIPSAVVQYLFALVIPWRAAPARHLPIAASLSEPSFYMPVALLTAIGGLGFMTLRRHPRRRLYCFCAAWFLIALAPMLNLGGLFPASVVDDRYLYFPSIAFWLFIADLTISTWPAPFEGGIRREVALGAVAFLALCAAIDFSAQSFWRSDAALFSAYSAAAPEVEFFHYRLGVALAERGEYAAARSELKTARSMDPGHGWNLYNLALVDERMGDRRDALETISAALDKIEDPTPAAFIQFALVADAAGDSARAESALQRAALLPGGANAAELTRAQLRFHHGDSAGAETAVRKLLAHDPADEPALSTLGAVLAAEKRYADALEIDRRAQALAPDEPLLHYPIAYTLHRLGREREAREECAIALAGAPNEPKVRALMDEIDRALDAAR
ncbi:MAG TPA: tetratricopeptide repeat protein [Candidatus Binataceae bacterium]|nr:tetratricopeptide repeat protein [Candidatus Binataceae bacterium]